MQMAIYSILFWNTRAKTEGGQFRRLEKSFKLIGYHSNVPWVISKQTSD